jgi:N-methylhydantoinase A
MILADVVKDYSQTIMLPVEEMDTHRLDHLFAPLYDRARADLATEGQTTAGHSLLPALDMRYVGQSYELTIPLGQHTGDPPQPPMRQIVEQFHAAHQQRFSYASKSEPIEVVTLRLKAVGRTAKPKFQSQPQGKLDPSDANIGYKVIHFADAHAPQAARPMPAALYERGLLAPGNIVVGPAVVLQLDTTTVIPPAWAATMDSWGNLLIERRVHEPA